MLRFDFTKAEYEKFMDQCPFTDEEKEIFLMRRSEKSIVFMAQKLNVSERTIKRRIKAINVKIIRCL